MVAIARPCSKAGNVRLQLTSKGKVEHLATSSDERIAG
jgi:hypothetical protein